MTQSKRRPSRRGAKMVYWTDEDLARLRELVAEKRLLREAFEAYAAESGRAFTTVQKKWYTISKATKIRPLDSPSVDVRHMDTDSLVTLHRSIKEEIDRRIAELQKAVGE